MDAAGARLNEVPREWGHAQAPSTKEQHPAGTAAGKGNRMEPQTPGLCCLSCLVCWTQSCVPNLAVYKVWKVSQPESFHRAPSTSSRSYGKGAGELSFEQHWRKWVGFYGITPHLAEQNCYQMWPCSGLGISNKLKGGCAGCQMTYSTWNLLILISTQYPVFTVRITTTICPGNTDTEGRTLSRAVPLLEVWLIKGHSSSRAGILFQLYSLWNYGPLITNQVLLNNPCLISIMSLSLPGVRGLGGSRDPLAPSCRYWKCRSSFYLELSSCIPHLQGILSIP